MKKVLILICAYCILAPANAMYKICGPDTNGMDYAYSDVVIQNERYIGAWAVGVDCGGGKTDNTDIDTMCTEVIVGGEAYCAAGYWTDYELDETTHDYGAQCFCRKTKVRTENSLMHSKGQWVLIGHAGKECRALCAMYCAQNIVNSIGDPQHDMRNAIMLLPAS